MCIGEADYEKEEVEAALDDRFDRVIGSSKGSDALIKMRVGNNVLSLVFGKDNGEWHTRASLLKQIPAIKH